MICSRPRALVTGATGFIGKKLIEHLLKNQFLVRSLIRNQQNTLHLPAKIEIIEGDLTKPDTLKGACANIDIVFHLGGYAHAWEEGAKHHHAINFLGTQHILQEAIGAKVKKFIFFSSVKAVADHEHYIDESWDKQPNSPYGISKRQAEELVLNAKNKGMHVCVLRPSLVYGPEWKGNLAVMLRAIDQGIFPPLPEMHNSRSMISVDDICQAALLAANHPEANGKVYFVTDGISYTTRQIYSLMCEALGKPIPYWHVPFWFFKLIAFIGDIGKKIFRRRMPFDSDALSKLFGSAYYNTTKIQRELGFHAIQNLKSQLPEIIYQHRKCNGHI